MRQVQLSPCPGSQLLYALVALEGGEDDADGFAAKQLDIITSLEEDDVSAYPAAEVLLLLSTSVVFQ